MSGGIFISYRRDDAAHAAGRLVDRLQKTYKRDQIFIDIDNIDPGLDFVRALSEKVAACDVLLAIIGPGWLDARDDNGQRRLDNPKDFVRIEIEAALKRDVRVVPVLVDGAPIPHEEQLPEMLRDLSRRQAVRLAHERFAADADGLTIALEKIVLPRGVEFVTSGTAMPRIDGAKPNAATGQPRPSLFKFVVYCFLAGVFLLAAISANTERTAANASQMWLLAGGAFLGFVCFALAAIGVNRARAR